MQHSLVETEQCLFLKQSRLSSCSDGSLFSKDVVLMTFVEDDNCVIAYLIVSSEKCGGCHTAILLLVSSKQQPLDLEVREGEIRSTAASVAGGL